MSLRFCSEKKRKDVNKGNDLGKQRRDFSTKQHGTKLNVAKMCSFVSFYCFDA